MLYKIKMVKIVSSGTTRGGYGSRCFFKATL